MSTSIYTAFHENTFQNNDLSIGNVICDAVCIGIYCFSMFWLYVYLF